MKVLIIFALFAISKGAFAAPGEVKGVFFSTLWQTYVEAVVVEDQGVSGDFLAVRIKDRSYITIIKKKDFLVPMDR